MSIPLCIRSPPPSGSARIPKREERYGSRAGRPARSGLGFAAKSALGAEVGGVGAGADQSVMCWWNAALEDAGRASSAAHAPAEPARAHAAVGKQRNKWRSIALNRRTPERVSAKVFERTSLLRRDCGTGRPAPSWLMSPGLHRRETNFEFQRIAHARHAEKRTRSLRRRGGEGGVRS